MDLPSCVLLCKGKRQYLSRLPALYLCVGSWERILSMVHYFIWVSLCTSLCEHLVSCVSFPIFWTSRGQFEQISNEKRETTKGWARKGRGLGRETHFLFPPDQVPVTHYKCVTCLVLQKSRYAVSPEGCNASPTKAWLELEILCSLRLCPRSQSQAVQPAPRQLRSICLRTVRDELPAHHKQRCNVLIALTPENFVPSGWKL